MTWLACVETRRPQVLSIQALNSLMALSLAHRYCGNELLLVAVARALNLPLRISSLPKVQSVPTSWLCIGKAIAHNLPIFDALLTVRYSLIGPGDHVICVYPTYQQLYDVPRSIGAEVTLWKLKEEENFVPNTNDLVGMIQDNTKVRMKAIRRELSLTMDAR